MELGGTSTSLWSGMLEFLSPVQIVFDYSFNSTTGSVLVNETGEGQSTVYEMSNKNGAMNLAQLPKLATQDLPVTRTSVRKTEEVIVM